MSLLSRNSSLQVMNVIEWFLHQTIADQGIPERWYFDKDEGSLKRDGCYLAKIFSVKVLNGETKTV